MRESREVRFRFSGDEAVCRQLIPHARTLLGEHKQLLSQSRVESGSRTVRRGDVVIQIDTVMGVDTISILAPPPPPPNPTKAYKPGGLVGVPIDNSHHTDDGNDHPTGWGVPTSADTERMFKPPLAPGHPAQVWTATDMDAKSIPHVDWGPMYWHDDKFHWRVSWHPSAATGSNIIIINGEQRFSPPFGTTVLLACIRENNDGTYHLLFVATDSNLYALEVAVLDGRITNSVGGTVTVGALTAAAVLFSSDGKQLLLAGAQSSDAQPKYTNTIAPYTVIDTYNMAVVHASSVVLPQSIQYDTAAGDSADDLTTNTDTIVSAAYIDGKFALWVLHASESSQFNYGNPSNPVNQRSRSYTGSASLQLRFLGGGKETVVTCAGSHLLVVGTSSSGGDGYSSWGGEHLQILAVDQFARGVFYVVRVESDYTGPFTSYYQMDFPSVGQSGTKKFIYRLLANKVDKEIGTATEYPGWNTGQIVEIGGYCSILPDKMWGQPSASVALYNMSAGGSIGQTFGDFFAKGNSAKNVAAGGTIYPTCVFGDGDALIMYTEGLAQPAEVVFWRQL